MLIVCGAKTLKLTSLKVQHLTNFFRKDFMSVQSKIEPFERPMAFQRTAPKIWQWSFNHNLRQTSELLTSALFLTQIYCYEL